MISLKKILVSFLLVSYTLTLQPVDGYAKNKTSRSSKSKKKSSRKKNSSKNNLKSASSENNEDIVSGEENQTETTQQVSNDTVVNTTNTSVPQTTGGDEDVSTTVSSGEIKDMSKDSKWEDFRICMQTSCSGSDTQPNNVECYKSLNFDNVFMNCKMLVEESKREDFRNYFAGPFLKAEKKAFCEGEVYNGKFDDVSGRCSVSVKYTRPAYSGKQYQCSAESKTKTYYIDNKNYICSGENFGAVECYKDSPNYTSAQIQKWTGIAQLAAGAISGVAAGVTSAKSAVGGKVAERDSQGNAILDSSGKIQYTDNTEKKGALQGTMDGLQASSGYLSSGATAIATAAIYEKEKGDRIYGICNLPNGEIVNEGSTIRLSW